VEQLRAELGLEPGDPCDSDGCDTWSAAAAAVNVPASTTPTTYSTCLSSMDRLIGQPIVGNKFVLDLSIPAFNGGVSLRPPRRAGHRRVGGFLGGLFGKGGSAIATPSAAAIGIPPYVAVASPLPATIPATLVAARTYWRATTSTGASCAGRSRGLPGDPARRVRDPLGRAATRSCSPPR
jgi:hypothetical protein